MVSGTLIPPQVPGAGSACNARSRSVILSRSPQFHPCGTQFRWLIIAPLGNDVVPEVYRSVKTSSGPGCWMPEGSTADIRRREEPKAPPDEDRTRATPAASDAPAPTTSSNR